LEDKLKGDYPVLYNGRGCSITLEYDESYQFEDVRSNTLSLPSSNVENNPDNYLKPLDIVK